MTCFFSYMYLNEKKCYPMQVFMKNLKTADSLLHSCPTLHIVKFVPVLEVTHIDMQ